MEARLAPPSFVLDVHLAKLARHLRMVGIDSLWRPDYADPELLSISEKDARILLTRDQALAASGPPQRSYSVAATDPDRQFLEVASRFGLTEWVRSGRGFLTRCLECNSLILPVKPEYIQDRIPARLLEEHRDFFLCPRCERVYWKGSHFERMKLKVLEWLKEGDSSGDF